MSSVKKGFTLSYLSLCVAGLFATQAFASTQPQPNAAPAALDEDVERVTVIGQR